MPDGLFVTVLLILLALSFDFINGFHDAANSIATVVSTRVLTPRQAVLWAAFFNFAAAFFFGTAVAKTIGKGMIDISVVDQTVIFAGLIGAIVWDLVTWWWGLPTSSSHALIGGYAGAAVAKAGFGVLHLEGWTKTLLFIVVAPLIGLVLGLAFFVLLSWILRSAPQNKVNKYFRKLQLLSAALYSLGHGTNDAQKTMGIIVSLLVVSGFQREFHVPIWVELACYGAIALGTMSGGWRIVKTMGQKITKLKPFGGFCAETAGASSLFLATALGVPVSTTHVITGAIAGVGSAGRLSAVRWGITTRIVWAWVLTVPCSALTAMVCYKAATLFR
ncbi:MAG: inorganic phosphate transporter [Armatimonadetes bacterium]|nr:inorganic phosphate transporter [Armatimonadota bacterium]